MEKKSLLYRLGETKLKVPKGLRKYIFNETDYRTSHMNRGYVNTLEMWRGRLLMRTFAYDANNKAEKNMPIQEICRRLEGEKYVLLCQAENSFMGGRRVYFTKKGEWVTNKEKSTYYSWYSSSKKNWWFYGYDMFDIDEWIQRLNIPYCAYNHPSYMYKLPFIEYYELYKQYPKVELLVKAGYEHLITGARYFDFNKKSFEGIFKIPKKWQENLRSISVSDILLIRKYKLEDMEELKIFKNFKCYKLIKKYYCKRMAGYLGNYSNDYLYNDYLRFCEELGMPMNDPRILYPKDLHKSHDKMMNQIEINKSKKLQDGIRKTAEKLCRYTFKDEDFVIMPAQSYEDLINESKALNHCVRTYAESVAEGNTGIMLLRKADDVKTPFVTIELRGKKVLQARAEHNKVPPVDAQQFISKWEKQYRLEGY